MKELQNSSHGMNFSNASVSECSRYSLRSETFFFFLILLEAGEAEASLDYRYLLRPSG